MTRMKPPDGLAKSELKRWFQCKRKKPHDSRVKAESAAAFVRKRPGARGVRAYKCPFEDHWHIGHAPKHKMQGSGA